MKCHLLTVLILAGGSLAAGAASMAGGAAPRPTAPFGRIQIATIPFPADLAVRSATYTPSGKVLVSYADKSGGGEGFVRLAVMDDDGRNLRPFFARQLPPREKANGIRYMVFPDNKRIFLGDFILECATPIDNCERPALLPVDYPPEVAGGDHIAFRWSEMVVAPDNRHVAWTTLFANYSAMVFVGELQRQPRGYRIVRPMIVSTFDQFRKDPRHSDGVIPNPVRGGEVKQFVRGGAALSLVGAVRRDTPDSVVQDLATGRVQAITDTPGYTETTIFSPDERLGITMTSRFSPRTDPAILGLVPRPYPASLRMDLSMLAYTYAVTGVRASRSGNVGPALIDIRASQTQPDYRGVNLNTEDAWVFHSPMSWHPDGTRAMWIEGLRGDGRIRMQVVRLPDYRPAAPARVRPVPRAMRYASQDMSLARSYAASGGNIGVKVYGRARGHIVYRRTPAGLVEKVYSDFSDDGRTVYSGTERMEANPRGRSTYTAKLRVSGSTPGAMDLKMTFGPLGGPQPARLIFDADASGVPLSHGYAEYGGRRLTVNQLIP